MSNLVSTEWLAANLDDVRVVDASWYMPNDKREPKAEFETAHIPGAVFFDIDTVADRTTDLPHMMPTAEAFARAVGALGIGNDRMVVVYDGAPRASCRSPRSDAPWPHRRRRTRRESQRGLRADLPADASAETCRD